LRAMLGMWAADAAAKASVQTMHSIAYYQLRVG